MSQSLRSHDTRENQIIAHYDYDWTTAVHVKTLVRLKPEFSNSD